MGTASSRSKNAVGEDSGVTQAQVCGSVAGKTATKREALSSLAGSADSRVRTKPGSREGSLLYFFVPADDQEENGAGGVPRR